ncbi:alanine racemase (plasmid) [Ensifer adhaerens]|uniref:alanine racemase n=1 Tax=Ensifer adhaerens TaxID=106592 RepID=UPI0023A9670A|nr:alanine racemase [Ensifer adhaerens]WDZ80629.1 alanine racemase [Ensifer adhaerens]
MSTFEVTQSAASAVGTASADIDNSANEVKTEGFLRPAAAEQPTPYIEVDERRLTRNINAMQQRADAAGVTMFPHVKTHKSLHIARQQQAAGARGITASKPSEALIFAEAGIPSIILAYPIVRAASLDRLLPVVKARGVELRTIAASETGVDALSEAAIRHDVEIGVFLKVDVGLGRVGIKPSDPAALELCARVAAANGLRFAGLLSHAGHAYAAAQPHALAKIARDEATDLEGLASRLRQRGIAVDCISVGATPTCLGAPLPREVDCIRPGNYVFLDGTALRLGICTADDLALCVVARVVASNDTHFIIDAGSKSMSSDRGAHGMGGAGFGTVVSAEGDDETRMWTLERLSEEHGFVPFSGHPLPLGSRVRVFPNHSCASIANFDSFVLRRSDGDALRLPLDARSGQT